MRLAQAAGKPEPRSFAMRLAQAAGKPGPRSFAVRLAQAAGKPGPRMPPVTVRRCRGGVLSAEHFQPIPPEPACRPHRSRSQS
jgi:hypothetical protein